MMSGGRIAREAMMYAAITSVRRYGFIFSLCEERESLRTRTMWMIASEAHPTPNWFIDRLNSVIANVEAVKEKSEVT